MVSGETAQVKGPRLSLPATVPNSEVVLRRPCYPTVRTLCFRFAKVVITFFWTSTFVRRVVVPRSFSRTLAWRTTPVPGRAGDFPTCEREREEHRQQEEGILSVDEGWRPHFFMDRERMRALAPQMIHIGDGEPWQLITRT